MRSVKKCEIHRLVADVRWTEISLRLANEMKITELGELFPGNFSRGCSNVEAVNLRGRRNSLEEIEGTMPCRKTKLHHGPGPCDTAKREEEERLLTLNRSQREFFVI